MEINKIYNGDCLEIMKNMPDNFIDLTVTSPPYDNLRTYNGYTFDFEAIAKELYRITKIGGVIVWVVGDATINGSETGTSFKQALFFKNIGFNLHDTMIYAKKNYIPLTHNRYEQAFEYMFILSKNKPNIFNPIMTMCISDNKVKNYKNSKTDIKYAVRKRDSIIKIKKTKYINNIWYYNVGHNDNTTHTAPFPEQLANDHIISWSNKNDLVFDPFCGSGTTLKMAILNNRNYIGIDISKEYCDISEKRVKEAKQIIKRRVI